MTEGFGLSIANANRFFLKQSHCHSTLERQAWCVCSVTTVWSISERFRGELLTTGRYTNLFPFIFLLHAVLILHFNVWIFRLGPRTVRPRPSYKGDFSVAEMSNMCRQLVIHRHCAKPHHDVVNNNNNNNEWQCLWCCHRDSVTARISPGSSDECRPAPVPGGRRPSDQANRPGLRVRL